MSAVHYRSMMSSSDAIIWNIERDPHLRSTVMGVWLLDAPPAAARMAANIDRMVGAIPRLRQRVVEGRPRPSWVEVPELDLDHHYEERQLPTGSGWDDVLAHARSWVREPFDRSRPLWRLGLLTGLADGRAAVVIKIHHAIADGMGMVLMLAAFTDLEPHPKPQPLPVAERPTGARCEVFSPARRAVFKARRALATFGRAPWRAAGETARTVTSAIRVVMPNRTPHSRLMTKRSSELWMHTRQIPLDAVRAAGRAVDASLNDTFVTVVANAIERYHASHGVACPKLRVHMPVNIRNERTAALAGNQFVPARVSLRLTGQQCPAARISSVRDQLDELRSEPALPHINTVSAAIQRLGKPVSRWIIGGMMKSVDVLASNVPGPPFPLYLAGSRIEQFFAFGPPAGAALNVTLFSYDGTVHLGITTDGAAVTDRERFLACLDESVATLVAAPVTIDRAVLAGVA